MKKFLLVLSTAILSLFMCFSAFAKTGTWIQSSNGMWWFRYTDGTYPANGWQQIDNVYYYFDSDGWMLQNTTTPDGYYVDSSGAWDGKSVASSSSSNITETYSFNNLDRSTVKISGNKVIVSGNWYRYNDYGDVVDSGYMNKEFNITSNTKFYTVGEDEISVSKSNFSPYPGCEIQVLNGNVIYMASFS